MMIVTTTTMMKFVIDIYFCLTHRTKKQRNHIHIKHARRHQATKERKRDQIRTKTYVLPNVTEKGKGSGFI